MKASKINKKPTSENICRHIFTQVITLFATKTNGPEIGPP
jgi:hypothetical protein